MKRLKIRGTNAIAAPLNVFPTAGYDEGSFQVDGAMRRKGSAGHAIAVTGVRRAHFISYGRMRPTNHSTCSFFAILGSSLQSFPGNSNNRLLAYFVCLPSKALLWTIANPRAPHGPPLRYRSVIPDSATHLKLFRRSDVLYRILATKAVISSAESQLVKPLE